MKLTRTRPEGCLSDYALEQRLAGELDAARMANADSHVAECTRCDARAAELTGERAAFAANAPPLPSMAARRPSARSRFARIAPILALAAVIVLFVAFRRNGNEDEPGTRAKGDIATLAFYVNHDGAIRAGAAGEHVTPGDGLRFVVNARELRYLAVLSVDGARHASVYYPTGPEAAAVPAGQGTALPQSTTLDDVLGDEKLYGVFCPAAFPVEPLRRALETSPEHPPSPPGCSVDVLHVRKDARPTP